MLNTKERSETDVLERSCVYEDRFYPELMPAI